MNVNSTIQTGLQGIREGQEGIAKAATDIVRSASADGAVGSNDLVDAVVDLKLYERSVEGSAQVVRSADETLGTLLDTLA